MKKKLIISVIFIIVFIILLLIINKQLKSKKLVVKNISTNQINRTEKNIQSQEHPIQLLEPEIFTTNDSVLLENEFINLHQLTNIILSKSDYSYRRKQRIIKEVIPEIFQTNNEIQLTNLIELLLQKHFINQNNIHEPYSDLFVLLRYRKLLPYMARKILGKSHDTNNINDVQLCISWLDYVPHPNTLRTILELDKLIPMDSALRKKTHFGELPFFYRRDCLDVYMDVANHPEKYRYYMWNSAVYNIVWFTNDVAIHAHNRAYQVMKNYKKYWPELPDATWMDIECMKSQMESRQRIIDGIDKPRKQPKPILDE